MPTPLVNEVDYNTLLPLQPCWVWNINLDYPWFIYNHPVTDWLYYWDLWTGFNSFPTPGTGPSALSLFFGYEWMVPDFDDFAILVNQANLSYVNATTGLAGALGLAELQKPALFWGVRHY